MNKKLYDIFRVIPRVSTDSRNITPNSIFFALHGESFDGNDYAIRALNSGAIYSVIDRAEIVSQNPTYTDRLIVVGDTLLALQSLAREHRRNLGIEILAISGSNGKTTTKELLSRVIGTKYKCYSTRGNLNNHIGVPLTLLSMDHTTEFGVVEMGASSCGEIKLLCSIAQPNYGILTNVGRAHLEGFGGEEGVKRGKGELLDYLAESGGVAFIANQNETIRSMADSRPTLGSIRYDYTLAEGVPHNLEGEYNRYNVAAAVAVGHAFEIPQELITEAIAGYTPDNNRSQRIDTERNTIIADCYNANPSSMEAAIGNFASEMFAPHPRKALILGDMFELGEWSLEEHQRVINLAKASGAEKILLVGQHFAKAGALDSGERIEFFTTRTELEEHLLASPLGGYTILVKGSRGVGLENIIAFI